MNQARASLEAGQVVRIRGRRGVIDEPPEFDPQSSQHLVRIRYLDDEDPEEETCLWEREPATELIQRAGFPPVEKSGSTPPDRYRAYLDAIRWSTKSAYPEPAQLFLTSPLRSSILLHNYQLYPLYKAMLMPSVRLFLADDVGLGKTIEAGLVTSELIAQRGIRRILIICPASLQRQWKDELKEKFHLDFTILDRDEIYDTKQKDPTANPWLFHQKIITSMDFLKREEVLDEFEQACRKMVPEGSGRFPWDAVIVDEVHHFAPQPTGDDTARMEMLREVMREFEHRIFLSATPHNGYQTSFTGLLNFLDPVRFQKQMTLDAATKAELRSVFVRRLKEDINREDPDSQFQIRDPPIGLRSDPTDPEAELIKALRRYDQRVRDLPGLSQRERSALRFVRSIFTKRLLSSPYAFARTWWSHREAYRDTVSQSRLSVDEAVQLTDHLERTREDVSDDVRADEIDRDASRAGGSVLHGHLEALSDYAQDIDEALWSLGLPREVVEEGIEGITSEVPDAKWETFHAHISEDGRWDPLDEDPPARVVVFTEFRDTQDYLIARLQDEGVPEEHILSFSGGASFQEREEIKAAFNDEDHPVNILVATDAASEGLNLQSTCRYVVHHDLPWNPLKIDQRIGRLDRHGQTETVRSWHHILDTVEEYEFLSHVSEKAEQARSDLGRLAPLLESGVGHALVGDDDVDLDQAAESVDDVLREDASLEELGEAAEQRVETYGEAREATEKARANLEVTPGEMALVLEQALRLEGGELRANDDGTYDWKAPQSWEPHVETLRRKDQARRKIVFEGDEKTVGPDAIKKMRARDDLRIVGLGHPVMTHAIRRLRRFLWGQGLDKESTAVTKWTSEVPPEDADTAVVTFLTLARNQRGEVVHEALHHEALCRSPSGFEPLDETPPMQLDHERSPPKWASQLEPVATELAETISERTRDKVTDQLDEQMEQARESYQEWLDRSIESLEEAAKEGAREEILRLEREIDKWENKAAQKRLDPVKTARNQWELNQRKKEKRELESMFTTEERLKRHREHIEWEAEKYLDEVFPARYELGHVETLIAGVRFTNGGSR